MKSTLKPGCLAMIIRSMAGNEGKIVTCVELLPNQRFLDGSIRDAWQVDQTLNGTHGLKVSVVPAIWLIPINDPDLEIETISEEKIKEKV